ncbi:hypothetical protein L9F63_010645, partial [Diploptera punctata]
VPKRSKYSVAFRTRVFCSHSKYFCTNRDTSYRLSTVHIPCNSFRISSGNSI